MIYLNDGTFLASLQTISFADAKSPSKTASGSSPPPSASCLSTNFIAS